LGLFFILLFSRFLFEGVLIEGWSFDIPAFIASIIIFSAVLWLYSEISASVTFRANRTRAPYRFPNFIREVDDLLIATTFWVTGFWASALPILTVATLVGFGWVILLLCTVLFFFRLVENKDLLW